MREIYLFLLIFLQVDFCLTLSNVEPITIEVSWNKTEYLLHTIPSVLAPANPLSSRQFSPVNEQIYKSLKELNVEYARYGAWFPFPHMSVAELDPPSGLFQCGNVATNYSVHLSCERGGGVISQINFASFGTATGWCGQMTLGKCHAQNSTKIVENLCLNKQKCSVPATGELFGDPCVGTVKRLLITIECNPAQNNTYYNFTYMDPPVKDFLDATQGHSRVIDFCTQPNWLFELTSPHIYPDSPIAADWSYTVGKQFIDETLTNLGDYFGRIIAWYTNGGFVDEYGYKHLSGYNYSFDYYEIFNEVDMEHDLSPQLYTKAYDAVVQGIRRHTNNTQMKFVGMVLGYHNEFDFYRYFLNHSNHAEGIPLDMIAYHYYSIGHNRTDPNDWESFFTQFDPFIEEVKQIEQIRKSLSPETRTTIDELGVILPDDNSPTAEQFPLIYWNAASAFYAYAWGILSQQGIDVIAHSQLVGYPQIPQLNFSPNYPSVTMLNWTTGEGTAKYWTTKLLIETAQIDRDHAVQTQTSDSKGQMIYTQAFLGENQRKWILIVNKRFVHVQVQLTDFLGAQMFTIDESTANSPPKQTTVSSNIIDLNPFAILIIRTS